MPQQPKLTALAHALARGETVEAAMLEAGYAASTAKKGMVMHEGEQVPPMEHPVVAGIVAELQAEARQRTLVTVDSLTEKMFEVFKGASKANQWGSAQQALMGVAKIHGLANDKRIIYMKRLEELTEDEAKYLMGKGPHPDQADLARRQKAMDKRNKNLATWRQRESG